MLRSKTHTKPCVIDGSIQVNRQTMNPDSVHYIPLNEVDTPEKLNRQILNLASKTWATTEMIYEVMQLAKCNSGNINFG